MITDNDNKYNKEPVYFCKDCGSLCIKTDTIGDYCYDCSGANISKASISAWRELIKNKFNRKTYV